MVFRYQKTGMVAEKSDMYACGNEDPHRPTLHECLSRFDIVVVKSMSKDSCKCANCL
jgi:hypothetical protein